MSRLVEQIAGWLKEDGLKFKTEKHGIIFSGTCGTVNAQFFYQIDEEARIVSCFALYPVMVPEEYRPEVSELLIRINYCLRLGALDLDFEDGEIRFRYSLLLLEQEPAKPTFVLILQLMSMMIEKYTSYLLAVSQGKKAAGVAFEEIRTEERAAETN